MELLGFIFLLFVLPKIYDFFKQNMGNSFQNGDMASMVSSPLDHVLEEYTDRMIDRKICDFLLPQAAFPAPENDFVPEEGFMLFD